MEADVTVEPERHGARPPKGPRDAKDPSIEFSLDIYIYLAALLGVGVDAWGTLK